MEPLGKRLRGFHPEKGLSKRALAELLGVSVPTPSRREERSEPRNRHEILRIFEGDGGRARP